MPDAELEEPAAAIAVTRLVLRPSARIQAPPNLVSAPNGDNGEYSLIIGTGIDDWGGVSPLTPDQVNPERPWPHIEDLGARTGAEGFRLRERLTVYPEYLLRGEPWLDPRILPHVQALADPVTGLAREDAKPVGLPWQEPEDLPASYDPTDLHRTIDTEGRTGDRRGHRRPRRTLRAPPRHRPPLRPRRPGREPPPRLHRHRASPPATYSAWPPPGKPHADPQVRNLSQIRAGRAGYLLASARCPTPRTPCPTATSPGGRRALVSSGSPDRGGYSMSSCPTRGRVYRRCGCRDENKRQIGTTCPQLRIDEEHGSWAYAVDLPSMEEGRKTRRRSGYRDHDEALHALELVLSAEHTGVLEDPRITVGAYLAEWLALKERTLKPSTTAGYRTYVRNDLLPTFGTMRLRDLRSRHIEKWVADQLADGRGRVAVYRAGATFRSALGSAVRTRRLAYNPALHAIPARPAPPERTCWTPAQAATFLRHNANAYADQLWDLFELVIGTGLRRGEALGLHWADVHLMERKLFVRWTLATIDNNHLYLGPPKTKASRNWVSLSPRVISALRRQADHQRALLPAGAPLEGLVFGGVDGAPLRPQWVLNQLRRRSAEAGVPLIGLHDLRHTAATIMISEGVPLAVVSKTLRHSTLATTINTYGHLLKYAADDAVMALSGALDLADATTNPSRLAPGLGFAA